MGDRATLLTCTYVVTTPCHRRRVYLDERELEGQTRSVTVSCPACARVWLLHIPLPRATWTG